MKRIALGVWAGLLLGIAAAAAADPSRVGDWEIGQRAVFAVASAPRSQEIHFAYVDGNRIFHVRSPDGGVTWSAPEMVANGTTPELAVDGRGAAHLVYEAPGTTHIEYRSFARGVWSSARKLDATVPGRPSQTLAPRIAIDGAGHVHVIYWALWKAADWKPGSRTAYWRKPADSPDFEAPLLWGHQRDGGNARYGTLAVDPAGDLHVFYATNNNMSHAIERRLRRQDGTWGGHDLWRGQLVADWCIGAAVTADGIAHLTVHSKLDDGLHVFYANTRADPAVRTLQHDFGPENYETVTQLLATPDVDLWFAAGHIEHRENAPAAAERTPLNLATWARFSAATGTWSARTPVSPPGAINLDARRGNHPRLVLVDGQVRLFYAEQRPGEKWRHWQRALGP